jgi:hypothetical protein
MAADVVITEYTDPACPWAFSAEPFRRRLNWLYGDQIAWDVKLVGLSDGSGPAKFTPDMLRRRSRASTRCRSTRACATGWPPRCPPAARSWRRG